MLKPNLLQVFGKENTKRKLADRVVKDSWHQAFCLARLNTKRHLTTLRSLFGIEAISFNSSRGNVSRTEKRCNKDANSLCVCLGLLSLVCSGNDERGSS